MRVQAGAPLKDVNEMLAEHGLAFDNFGSIALQTENGDGVDLLRFFEKMEQYLIFRFT